MNVRVIIFHLFFILFSLALFGQKKINYPTVEKANIYNIYHGDSIYDPYQWMENLEDPRLKDWLKDQKNILEKQKSISLIIKPCGMIVHLNYFLRELRINDIEFCLECVI